MRVQTLDEFFLFERVSNCDCSSSIDNVRVRTLFSFLLLFFFSFRVQVVIKLFSIFFVGRSIDRFISVRFNMHMSPFFLCKNGHERVSWSSVCDGFQHCSDGSDELKCKNRKQKSTFNDCFSIIFRSLSWRYLRMFSRK